MASEPDPTGLSSALESLSLITDLSLIPPLFLGFATMIPTTDPQRTPFIFFNPLAHQLMLFQPTPNRKHGPPPASKSSIKAMPTAHITQQVECVICLEEMEVGGLAKQMPCNHKFHANCIEQWLELHGSCPVCRYQMPTDEEDEGKKVEDEASERGVEREIWVSFSFDSAISNGDSVQTPPIDSDHSYAQ